jgi:hypothetical protein
MWIKCYEKLRDIKLKKDTLKIISIVLMSLLITNAVWNLLKYYERRFSMTSPLIPDYVIEQFAQPYLIHSVFAIVVLFFSLIFFFRAKYKIVIGIFVAGMIVGLFI